MNTSLLSQLQGLLLGNTASELNLLRKAKALAVAIPLIAQSLVDTLGKKIRLRRQTGPGGCTDGKTIWLMDTPLPSNAKDTERFVLYVALKLGLVHHEVGHVNESDFSLGRLADPLERHLEGIVEDVRQENAHIQRFKAARKYLDALSIASIHLGLNSPVGADEPPIAVFTAYLLFRLRAEYRNEPHFQPLADQAELVMKDKFTRGVLVRLEALLPKFERLQSTADAQAMAKEIASFIRDEIQAVQQEQQQRQQQQQQQQQQQAASQGQGQGSASDDDTSDGESSDDTEAQAQADAQPQDSNEPDASQDNIGPGEQGQGSGTADNPSASDAQSGAGEETGGANGTGNNPFSDLDDAQLQQLAQALQDMLDGKDADQAKGDLDEAIRNQLDQLTSDLASKPLDGWSQVDIESIDAANLSFSGELYTGGDYDLNKAVSVVSRLRCRLKREMQAMSITKTDRGRHGGRIDVRMVYRAALGDPRIFRKVSEGITVDTSVLLLCDVSGSMHEHNKIALANQALYATACALQAMPGVEVAVAAFPGRQLVLPFGARANREQARFSLVSTGSTPMHEGVAMAHRMLSTRRKPRKLLMVLTDGEADCMGSAQASLDAAEHAGIETYGIGIMTDYVQHLFNNWAVVMDVEQLPEVMLTMLKGRLTQRRAA